MKQHQQLTKPAHHNHQNPSSSSSIFFFQFNDESTTMRTSRNIDDDEDGTSSTISSVHPDILLTHILTRIDGPTLASVSCASSQLHSLSTEPKLWSDICRSTWPSINHPRIQKLISAFSDGHRSFFSDSFPLLIPPSASSSSSSLDTSISSPSELISAVDIHYKGKLIFSNVQETETLTGWFRCSPFRIDLVDEKDVINTHIHFNNDDDTCRILSEEIRLSWIVLDPTGRRAANVSSGGRAVYVHRHWLTRDIEMKFVTVLNGVKGTSTEFVQSGITVRCGISEVGEVHVKEVSLKMEDMDGMNLSGKESLRILVKGMFFGRRVKGGKVEAHERFEEYLKRKEERKERKLRRVGILDSICVYFGMLILTCIFVKFAINLVGQT